MARYTGPVDRLTRREGRELFLKGERHFKGKSPLQKRPTPPGVHGLSRNKISPYGQQLREKQALKRIYGVLEKQFRLYFAKADRWRGVTGTTLLQLLEQRLDNVVFRAGFAATRAAARQLVSHGHVRVNGQKVNIPSYSVKPGDEITLSAKASAGKAVAESRAFFERKGGSRGWISFNPEANSAKFLSLPTREDLSDIQINEQMIVELYSR